MGKVSLFKPLASEFIMCLDVIDLNTQGIKYTYKFKLLLPPNILLDLCTPYHPTDRFVLLLCYPLIPGLSYAGQEPCRWHGTQPTSHQLLFIFSMAKQYVFYIYVSIYRIIN